VLARSGESVEASREQVSVFLTKFSRLLPNLISGRLGQFLTVSDRPRDRGLWRKGEKLDLQSQQLLLKLLLEYS